MNSSEIIRIVFEVRDGTAKREEVELLMAYFCELVEADEPVPHLLLQHFAECFRAFLTGYRFIGGQPRPEIREPRSSRAHSSA
jgi:hypothetical protein